MRAAALTSKNFFINKKLVMLIIKLNFLVQFGYEMNEIQPGALTTRGQCPGC
jgi:hypothetical protein